VREIKFRSWDKGAMRMTVYDFAADSVILSRLHVAMFADAIREPGFDLMQFTGLKDRKRTPEFPEGQRVFEYDWIKGYLFDHRLPTMGIVVYDSEHTCYASKNDAGLTPLSKIDQIEVFGTVWESPFAISRCKKILDLPCAPCAGILEV